MLSERWTQRGRAMIEAAKTTPAEVLLGWSAALMMSWMVASSRGELAYELGLRALPMAALGVVTSHAMSVLWRAQVITQRTRWALTLAYLAGLGVWGAWGFDPHAASDWWRWGLVSVAAISVFSLLPLALSRRQQVTRELFWTLNARHLARILTVGSYLMTLFLGLALAWAATDELLNLRVGGRHALGHLAAWLFAGMGPWLVAAGLTRQDQPIATLRHELRQLISIVCHGLLMPLTLLYMGILALYNARILIVGLDQAPRNIMSPLVLVAAALIVVGMMLAEQLRQSATSARCVFVRVVEWLPTAFLPLLPLALWAVWVRVEQYGWTEFRYGRLSLLVALGAVFALSTVQKLRGRPQPLAGVMATFAIIAVLSALGPWSALDVSRRDQLGRLKTLMHARGQLSPAGLMTPPPDGQLNPDWQANERFSYVCEHFGPALLEAHMQSPKPSAHAPAPRRARWLVRGQQRRTRCDELGVQLGLWNKRYGMDPAQRQIKTLPHYDAHRLPKGLPADALHLGTVHLYDTPYSASHSHAMRVELRLARQAQGQQLLRLSSPVMELNAPLEDLIAYTLRVKEDASEARHEAPPEQTLTLLDAQGEPRGVLLVQQASIERAGQEPWRVTLLQGALIVWSSDALRASPGEAR